MTTRTAAPPQQFDPAFLNWLNKLQGLPTTDQTPGIVPSTEGRPVVDQQSSTGKAKKKDHKRGGSDFNMSSFNVLGNSHTTAHGNKPGKASGVQRMHTTVHKILANKVDVVGFQELQHVQANEFLKGTHGKYGLFPKTGDTENAIAWNKEKFKLVKHKTINIPYFNGHKRKMPIVILEDKKTGQRMIFTNFHNPADTARFHHQEKWRDRATAIETKMVRRLEKSTGLPVFMTGDMNEKQETFNKITHGTNLHAAHGSRHQVGIDHMYGGPRAHFSRYVSDHSKQIKYASDHPMLRAHVHVSA